ncbi:unnamed protein product [Lactuca saligna]|uniref:Uncharacterized protein n=1 Tax=Lactuca saligna TaxID=75948 RepID=A0AA36EB40_LACSI|nr:unnamed protein product [Lactuca saligna]
MQKKFQQWVQLQTGHYNEMVVSGGKDHLPPPLLWFLNHKNRSEMDPTTHSLPPPFHTRNFNLHQFQQQNSEDEQSGTSGLNMGGQKIDREEKNNDEMLNTSGGGGSSEGKDGEMGRRPQRTSIRVKKQT